MNPDLLRLLLGRSFAPEATAAPTRGQRPVSASVAIEPGTSDAVRKLLTSPTADSLYALAGVPARGGEVPWEELTTTAGMYARSADKMMLNPYEAQPMVLSDGFTPMGRYFTDPNAPGHSVSRTDESWSPRMTLAHEAGHRYQYTKGTPPGSLRAGEESADAFAKAFDLLSKTGTPKDTADIEQRLTDMESKYPGTRKMLSNMLRSESQLFAGHPLQMLPDRMGNLDLISKYPTDVMGTPAQRKKTASAPVIKSRMEDVLKNMLIPQTP